MQCGSKSASRPRWGHLHALMSLWAVKEVWRWIGTPVVSLVGGMGPPPQTRASPLLAASWGITEVTSNAHEAPNYPAMLPQPCSPPTHIPVTHHVAPPKPMWGAGTIQKVLFCRGLSALGRAVVLENGAGDIKIRKLIISWHSGVVLGSGE